MDLAAGQREGVDCLWVGEQVEVILPVGRGGVALCDDALADAVNERLRLGVGMLATVLRHHLGHRLQPERDLLVGREREVLLLARHRVVRGRALVREKRERHDPEADHEAGTEEAAAAAARPHAVGDGAVGRLVAHRQRPPAATRSVSSKSSSRSS